MVDTLAILGCVVALVGTFCLVSCSRCQHYRMSWGGMRCVDCGMGIREIKVNHVLGLDSRKPNFITMTNDNPFDPVFEYLVYTLVKSTTHLRTYDEVVSLDPDAPPHIKELYESMMFRRHGIAWLWKKNVQTSHS